jgi:hypothetical protein
MALVIVSSSSPTVSNKQQRKTSSATGCSLALHFKHTQHPLFFGWLVLLSIAFFDCYRLRFQVACFVELLF